MVISNVFHSPRGLSAFFFGVTAARTSAGISGAKGTKAAADAGLAKTTDLAALRVEGANKPGDCHRLVSQLAGAGLNLRGLSASVCGKKYVLIVAFDSEADAAKAAQVIRAMNKAK